ncbi:MAG: hypothetical protein JRF72_01815 [Deltaproteobacteria bacterium]|jgi:hypothetical protein|nr:hypothetical protein [Deltaproteobacteria bacterium]
MNPTAQKAIEAYGGKRLWAEAARLEAEFSASGLAFILKRRPYFKRTKISMDLGHPRSRITPIGKHPEVTGVLDGTDVSLETATGEIIQTRKNARRYFPGGRRIFFWDDLDMAYFANYAMWNYLTLPSLLSRNDIEWRELEPGLLEAVFPPEIPTHSRIQRFRFDPDTGRLLQHDYTADIIGRLARAAHVVLEHAESDGVCYTSRRRVTPRSAKGRPRRGPTLIAIDLHDLGLKDE